LRNGAVGEGEGESGVAEVHCSFGQAKCSAGVMQLCRGCETADHLRKAAKIFDGSLAHCVQSMCLLGGLGACPGPWENVGNEVLRNASAGGYPHLS